MKTSPFYTVTSQYAWIQKQCPVNSMAEFDHDLHQQDTVFLPRIAFQAELTFLNLYEKRILMEDRFGRVWSVFLSNAKELIPELTKGSVNAWWTMVLKLMPKELLLHMFQWIKTCHSYWNKPGI